MLMNQKKIAKTILTKAMQIQCNPYKNFKGIFFFTEMEKKNPKTTKHFIQSWLFSQLKPEKEQNWMHQNP